MIFVLIIWSYKHTPTYVEYWGYNGNIILSSQTNLF